MHSKLPTPDADPLCSSESESARTTSHSVASTGTSLSARAARKDKSNVYLPVCRPAITCARAEEQCGVLRGVPGMSTTRTTSAHTPVAEEGWTGVGGLVPQACGKMAQFARASLRATFSRYVRIGFASGKSLAMRMLGRPVPAPVLSGAGDAYRRRRKTDFLPGKD
jgi:hypothetical protein